MKNQKNRYCQARARAYLKSVTAPRAKEKLETKVQNQLAKNQQYDQQNDQQYDQQNDQQNDLVSMPNVDDQQYDQQNDLVSMPNVSPTFGTPRFSIVGLFLFGDFNFIQFPVP